MEAACSISAPAHDQRDRRQDHQHGRQAVKSQGAPGGAPCGEHQKHVAGGDESLNQEDDADRMQPAQRHERENDQTRDDVARPLQAQAAAAAYLDFALEQGALYEAMFALPNSLRFSDPETRPELRAAFDALAAVVTPFCADVETTTETFWAALHGLAQLERSRRLRRGLRQERMALVVHALVNG